MLSKENRQIALIQRFCTYYADFRVPNGKRSRVSLQTTNLRVAKDKYAELVSRRKKAKENVVGDMEWDAFKDRLFRFMSAERSESTIRWTKLAIKHMEDFNTPRMLRDVTPNLLQGTKEFMINEVFSKHNINRCMQALKAIMQLAEKWDLAVEQKRTAVGKLKTPKGPFLCSLNTALKPEWIKISQKYQRRREKATYLKESF